MLVTTLATTLIQYLAQRAWGGVDPTAAWLRGGSIGMWTTVTAAALFGLLAFPTAWLTWALLGVGLVWHAMKRLRQGLRREAL